MNIKTVKIGEREFYIRKMGAFEALKVFGDLQKEILPALGGTLSGLADGNENSENMGAAIAALSSSVDSAGLEKWSEKLLFNGHVSFESESGEAAKLTKTRADEAFSDFTVVIELLIAVGMENFKGPLSKLLSRIGMGSLSTASLSESIATKY